MASASGQPPWISREPTAALQDQGQAAFLSGVQSGIGRVESLGYRVDERQFQANFATILEALPRLTADIEFEPSGLAFLAEMIATAVAVRVAHDEKPLTNEEFSQAFPLLIRFFNTIITGCNPH